MSKKLLFNFNREVIQNYTYVKYVGTIITATNTLEKPIKSAILKGNTLVNLFDKDTNDRVDSKTAVSVDGNEITITGTWFSSFKVNLKPSTKYTMFVEYLSGGRVAILDDYKNTGSSQSFNIQQQQAGTKGVHSFTTTATGSEYGILLYASGTGQTYKDVMIVEGDYTNTNIPYFEGMQSVKMPVLTTTGKNLFNDDLLVNKDIVINIDGVDVYKPIITSNYEFATTSDSGFRLKNNIFKDNTRYTLSFKFTENSSSALHKQIIYRYTDGETYQSWGEREGVVYYTTKANKTLETISVISRNSDGTNFGIYDVQLEEGSVLTDYEPYKSNILTVNEDVTLRSNGDIYDELNLLTGQLTQRIDENNDVLTQEVVKTVDLSILDQNENKVSSISSFNDTTHITASSETIPPIFEGYLATKEVE